MDEYASYIVMYHGSPVIVNLTFHVNRCNCDKVAIRSQVYNISHRGQFGAKDRIISNVCAAITKFYAIFSSIFRVLFTVDDRSPGSRH